MEALGEYIVNLLNNSIAKWLQDLFLGAVTAVMNWVSEMITNMWNIDVIKALVNCTSGISMGVFAVGAILTLYDIVEARSEEKVVYMSAVTKNFVAGLAFAVFGSQFIAVMNQSILSLCELLKISDSVRDFENTDFMNQSLGTIQDALTVSPGDLLGAILIILVVLIGSGVFVYKAAMRFVQFLTLILMVPLYVTSIARGDQTAFSAWFRQAMAVGLTYFFEYFLYALGIAMMASNGFATPMMGIACLIGMGSVSRTLDKYGIRCYRDYLYVQNNGAFITESVKRTVLASVNLMESRLNNRTNKVLSELAIQQAILCQVIAHELEVNPRALDNYRRAAVEYLKMNDRVFRLEDIVEE